MSGQLPQSYRSCWHHVGVAPRRFPPSVLRRCVVSGCEEEPQCSVADLRDADSAGFFSCSLYPDSRVCGAYDKPLRRPCSPLLDRAPNNTYSKKGKEGSSESHHHDFIAAPAVFKHRVCVGVCVCACMRVHLVDLSGPVKSFYERVSFKKMVSYSVRSRVSLGENTPLSEG